MSAREVWQTITIAPGYEASNLGNVRSFRPWRGLSTPRLLTPRVNNCGYLSVTVRLIDGRKVKQGAHALVADAFLGPRPEGLEIRHLDGDRLNNAANNLAYGTRQENYADMLAHGTHPQASKTHCPYGHPYDDLNTYRYGGRRQCRACNAQRAFRRQRAAS